MEARVMMRMIVRVRVMLLSNENPPRRTWRAMVMGTGRRAPIAPLSGQVQRLTDL